jgi:hypothetical protein
MDANREGMLIHRPQVLEDELAQAARVAEDERGAVRLDLLHHLVGRPAAAMTGPGHALVLRQHDRNVGLGAGVAAHQIDRVRVAVRREPGAVGVRIGNRGAEADPAQPGRQLLQP